MEFEAASENDKALTAPDDSNTGWDDEEETLSLCDFVKEQSAHNLSSGDTKLRDSNPGSSGLKEDFAFQTTHNICPAEDLSFPFSVQRCGSEFNAHFSQNKSGFRHESGRLLSEKLQAWRTDSSDIQPSSLTNDQASQRKGFQSASARNVQRGHFSTLSSSSTSKSNRTSKPPPRISKMCMKWQQFLTLGLMKSDPVTLEDMFLNPGKPNNDGLHDSVLKRSVSWDYSKSVMVEKKEDMAVKFQQKPKSAKGNLWAKGTFTSTLKSLNRCKLSTDSVKNCLVEDRKSCTSGPPVQSDQNAENLGQVSNDKGQGCWHSDFLVCRSTPKKSRWLPFQRGI